MTIRSSFTLILFVFALALRSAAATAPDLHAVIAAAILESDGNFDNRTGDIVTETDASVTYAAKAIEGLPGEQTIVRRAGLCFLVSKLTDPATLRSVHDAVVSLPAYKRGFGAYTLSVENPEAEKHVTVVSLNGRRFAKLTESANGTGGELMLGPLDGRPKLAESPDAPSPERAITDLQALLLETLRGSPFDYPQITRIEEQVTQPDKHIFSASPVAGYSGSSVLMHIPSREQWYYAVVIKDHAAVQQMTEAIKRLPNRYGAAWTCERVGRKIEALRDDRPLVDLNLTASGEGILIIGQHPYLPGHQEIFADIDRLLSAGAADFDGLTPEHLTRSAAVVAHPIKPLLHADKMTVSTGDDCYPFLAAEWVEKNSTADATYHSLYSYLIEQVGAGSLVIEGDTAMTHIYPDSRLVRFHTNGLYGTVSYRMGFSAPRLAISISRIAQPPWYREKAADTSYASTPASSSSSYSRSSAPAGEKMHHSCVRCDGRGTIETTDRYGTHVRTTCPICGGKGYTTN